MATCGSYSDWTDECRMPGCEKCGTLTFALGVPVGCTCPTELAGMVFIAQRAETCSVHGRCRCTSGAMRYDDHREQDYWPRKWTPACPISAHKQEAA